MSLALFSNGEMIGFGDAAHSAVIVFEDGSRLPIGFRRTSEQNQIGQRPPSGRTAVRSVTGSFTVALETLPQSASSWVRRMANEQQKRKRLQFRPTKQEKKKPPATISLPSDFRVVIQPHLNDGERDLLQIGRPLIITSGEGPSVDQFELGAIKEFVLIS